MNDLTICTIISKNYLPFARTLAESFHKYNEGKVYVLLVDTIDGYFEPENEQFELIELEELRRMIPDFEKFCFQYTILELNTGVKPYLLQYLFEKYNVEKLVYFDPDILITNKLDELSALLDNNSIILTPHLTSPIDDNYNPTEIDILKAGIYNLGFIALSNNRTVMNMLDWWQKRLFNKCIVAFEQGLFVDQKWIDLVPGFYPGVLILQHPGYNIAYWNYHCRKVRLEGDHIYVNDGPSYFLHFSGYDPLNIGPISKYQNRYTIDRLKEMRSVFGMYSERLISNGWMQCKNWPYAFGYFDNGIKIPDFVRRYYLELGEEVKKFGNPFSVEDENSYFQWLQENIDNGRPNISRLMYTLYAMEPEIQQTFPDIRNRDRASFYSWITKKGRNDYGIDDRLIESLIDANKKGKQGVSIKHSMSQIVNIIRSGIGEASKNIFGKNHPFVNLLRRLNLFIGRRHLNAANSLLVFNQINRKNRIDNIRVNIAGYIKSEHGVGEAVRANIRAFESAKIPYVLNNIQSSSRQEDVTFTTFSDSNPYEINFIHVNADQVQNYRVQKGAKYFEGKYNIGYWVWELSKFPDEWLRSFKYFNEIWTASQFSADSISKVSSIPVIRIPHSITMENIKPVKRSDFGLKDDSFIFLFMFDYYSFLERKNPLGLIEAFKLAFKENENVQLVLKCSNSKFNPEGARKIETASEGHNIIIIDSYFSKSEINSLHNVSDCFVSLHRSEGFGLPMAEAMYLGKPVIATAYSGNIDFMTVSNSFLVKYNLVEIEKDVGPYKSGSVWAEPDVNHAAELMRYVYENREGSIRTGQKASEDIKMQLSPIKVGRMISDRVQIVASAFRNRD